MFNTTSQEKEIEDTQRLRCSNATQDLVLRQQGLNQAFWTTSNLKADHRLEFQKELCQIAHFYT